MISSSTCYETGGLRKELIACLRQGKTKRRSRAGGVDRRQQIPDLVIIHFRPPQVDQRLLPGHWERDLIKGAFNRSAVGVNIPVSVAPLIRVFRPLVFRQVFPWCQVFQ